MAGIRLEGISKVYGAGEAAVRAVDDVGLSISSGEFFFLLGPSGCGKTTLLRIVAGLIEPTGGKVFFGRRDVTALPVEKRGTAMVFQNYALWPHMSVQQNVEFGPKMQGAPRRRRRELCRANLQRVQMRGFDRRKPNQLSGGQQQRVAVARALAAEPDFLLLDEPLSNLDARLRLHMRGELRRLVKDAGITALYVTHDQKEALSMADRIAVMDAGRIVQIGTPERLYNRPASRFVADFLGEANFIDGRLAQAGRPARVETPVATILAADVGELHAGAAVTCCVRPERIELLPTVAPQGDSTATWLPATLAGTTYLGEIRQYVCRLDEGTLWKVSALAGGGAPPQVGQRVTLRIDPADVAILAR